MPAIALTEARQSRVARIVVTPELILEMLKIRGGKAAIGDGKEVVFSESGDKIPETAKALRAGLTDSGSINLIIQDDTFAECAEGIPIPQLRPVYEIRFEEMSEEMAFFIDQYGKLVD